ncbi:uncharacterized protein LOC143447330 isoform X2 [Clavelina lepadiformis]|uniref:uncharacterized protein LOC143447330 isoform X2 n=1 Tax=Clavelina lepadiformis TaxID=159417 RepID=UPI0040432763
MYRIELYAYLLGVCCFVLPLSTCFPYNAVLDDQINEDIGNEDPSLTFPPNTTIEAKSYESYQTTKHREPEVDENLVENTNEPNLIPNDFNPDDNRTQESLEGVTEDSYQSDENPAFNYEQGSEPDKQEEENSEDLQNKISSFEDDGIDTIIDESQENSTETTESYYETANETAYDNYENDDGNDIEDEVNERATVQSYSETTANPQESKYNPEDTSYESTENNDLISDLTNNINSPTSESATQSYDQFNASNNIEDTSNDYYSNDFLLNQDGGEPNNRSNDYNNNEEGGDYEYNNNELVFLTDEKIENNETKGYDSIATNGEDGEGDDYEYKNNELVFLTDDKIEENETKSYEDIATDDEELTVENESEKFFPNDNDEQSIYDSDGANYGEDKDEEIKNTSDDNQVVNEEDALTLQKEINKMVEYSSLSPMWIFSFFLILIVIFILLYCGSLGNCFRYVIGAYKEFHGRQRARRRDGYTLMPQSDTKCA